MLAAARLGLGCVLIAAGAGKLWALRRTRESALALGVPRRAGWAVALLLPPVELAIGFALLWAQTARAAAVAALVLFALFSALLIGALARRAPVPCGCFGQARRSPLDPWELARNQLLIATTAFVLWQGWHDPGPDALAWLGALDATRLVLLAVGVGVVGAVARLIRGAAGLRSAVEPPPRPEPVRVPAATRTSNGRADAPVLTIGMATYDDFDGVYFTLEALRLYQDLSDTELLVVDNRGTPEVRDLVEGWLGGRYVLADRLAGTAYPRDLVFREAAGSAVLCCDSHVLFEPGVIERLKRYFAEHPGTRDLLQGPLVYDDGRLVSTHFEPEWREQMWGTWATDARGLDPQAPPFEIPMQGLGAFSCSTDAWPGLHQGFRGFGGEEGYLHEKFRRAGGRTLCLPWFRWLHRFARPRGVPFPLTVEDKFRNYLLGHAELGLDPAPVVAHFSQHLPAAVIDAVVAEVGLAVGAIR